MTTFDPHSLRGVFGVFGVFKLRAREIPPLDGVALRCKLYRRAWKNPRNPENPPWLALHA
jgi:hypothetical protein